MKVNREDIKWFLSNIERRSDGKELKDLTKEELANELANYMEVNPGCIDMNEASHSGRYYYSTVGYGVFSLLGERYRMGRIEIFDKKNESGYAVDEGVYCMPFVSANQFEDFIESIETDYPINIQIGSMKECNQAVSEEFGIPVELLNDNETKKQYYKKKNDLYAQENGFKDFEDYLANSPLGDLRIKKEN